MTLTDLDIETAAARETRSPENRKVRNFILLLIFLKVPTLCFFRKFPKLNLSQILSHRQPAENSPFSQSHRNQQVEMVKQRDTIDMHDRPTVLAHCAVIPLNISQD